MTNFGATTRPDSSASPATRSAYQAYLSQVGQCPPKLEPAEQIRLGKRIVAGKKLEAAYPDPTTRDRRTKQKIRRGRAASEKLVGSVLRLVIYIATDLAKKKLGNRFFDSLPDLIQEGNLGVLVALDRYDPERGTAFNSYAQMYIRQHVQEAIRRQTPVKVPTSWKRLATVAAGRKMGLTKTLGRTPTTKELKESCFEYCRTETAKRLTKKLPEAVTDQHIEADMRKHGILAAFRQFDQVLLLTSRAGSLDQTVGTDQDSTTTLGDLIADKGGIGADRAAIRNVEQHELREALQAALDDLDEREREIVLRRYGFHNEGQPDTYAKLGKQFGVTAERVRQLESRVLQKLADPHNQWAILDAYADSKYQEALHRHQTSTPQPAGARRQLNAADYARNIHTHA